MEHSDRVALKEVVSGAISCLPGDDDVLQVWVFHELINNFPLFLALFTGVFRIKFNDSVSRNPVVDKVPDGCLDVSRLLDAYDQLFTAFCSEIDESLVKGLAGFCYRINGDLRIQLFF